jgi:hypothetical protein
MTTLINLVISAFILRLIGIIVFLYIFKIGVKKFLNVDLNYKKIAIWFYNTIKSIFEVWK